jgi:UDP-N-acetylenolpyruvoylglucosamine reductase
MRVGGRAQWLLEPANPEELVRAWNAARERGYLPRILGGGAKLVIEDGELDGVVITTARMRYILRPGHS